MKKIIAILSTCMMFGFAIALAHADDTAATDSQTKVMGADQAGTNQPGASSGKNAQQGLDQSADTASKTANDVAKNATTCKDASGVTYEKGKAGFDTCIQQMHKAKEQMGGKANPDQAKDTLDSSTQSVNKAAEGVNSSDTGASR